MQLSVDGVDIPFTLVYAKRRTIGIQVHADGRVIVRAPQRLPYKHIEPFLIERAGWILRKQRELSERLHALPPPHQFVSGETFVLLGREYHLHVFEQTRTRVRADHGRLIVGVPDVSDSKRVQRAIERYIRRHAQRIFSQRMRVCFTQVEGWGVRRPTLRLRTMKSRWGSCTSTGVITLNTRLLHIPISLIDYVILHELCHLREMNHSARFYALMAAVCPDYKARRQALKGYGFIE
jgi:hypothetical protein